MNTSARFPVPNPTWIPILIGFTLAVATMAPLAQSAHSKDNLKSATDLANAIKARTGAKPAAPPLPSGDPCSALPLSSVQGIFPGAKAGERSRRLEEYGITECQWKGTGGDPVLVYQESINSGTSAKEDALGMAQGFVEISGKSLKNVRIESFPSLGVDAAAFIESADAKRGILSDGAMLEMRKGQHNVSINAPSLATRDRGQAMKALETLGKLAVPRLQ